MKDVSVQACAKVNLRLAVLGRLESGYHALETIFCGISLHDTLEIRGSTETGPHLDVIGEVDTGPFDQNLIIRAARSFFGELNRPPAVHIRLIKRIPTQAGLGGGSSDAAATLRALNAQHDYPFTDSDLLRIGAALGSDVPFFLTGSPLALAWGRGERLLELEPLPSRPLLLVNPGQSMPTHEAFDRLAGLRRAAPKTSHPLAFSSDTVTTWPGLTRIAANDFEPIAVECIEGFEEIRLSLVQNEAFISLLAGSGSSVFGIFDSAEDMASAERTLSLLGYKTYRASTLTQWPVVDSRD